MLPSSETVEATHGLPQLQYEIVEDVGRYLVAEVVSGHSYPRSQSSSLSSLFAFALEMHLDQHSSLPSRAALPHFRENLGLDGLSPVTRLGQPPKPVPDPCVLIRKGGGGNTCFTCIHTVSTPFGPRPASPVAGNVNPPRAPPNNGLNVEKHAPRAENASCRSASRFTKQCCVLREFNQEATAPSHRYSARRLADAF